jgi:hypothetical protein
MKPQSEAEITAGIRRLLASLGVWHWKHWSGPMTYPRGISDILGIWKGRFLAIEIKRPGGQLTVEQQRFLDRVKIEGGVSFVARSVDDVITELGVQDRFLFNPPAASSRHERG